MLPMLSGETEVIEFRRSFFLDEHLFPDVLITEPVCASGKIVDQSGYMKLTLEIIVKYNTACARCLLPLDKTLTLNFIKTIAVEGTLENEETDEVITEYILINENKLDLMKIAEEQLFFDFPFRHLCSEDCRGLCQKCGHDLNESDCGCSGNEIDPRLEVLKSLLIKSDGNDKIDD